jgi:hypothetical protein
MPKVCKEIFERTVVHTQYKIKEEEVDIWEESYISEAKGELKVEYEDKLLEIKILNCYSNLELTLNTNIYKDGIIVGKVYKIELDSEGDILYFLEPEYKLTQPNDTFKEYLRRVKDSKYCYETEERFNKLKVELDNRIKEHEINVDKFKNTIKEKNVRIESLEKQIGEKILEVRSLTNDYKVIESKNKEIGELKEKVKCIRNNIVNDMKEIMENTTILERLSMNRFISTLDDLKKY